jgi:hypothetical protein
MFRGSQEVMAAAQAGHDTDNDDLVVGWRGAPTSRHAVAARFEVRLSLIRGLAPLRVCPPPPRPL